MSSSQDVNMLDKGSEHSESDNSDYDDFSHGAHTPTPSRSARSSASVSLTASRKPRTATSSAQGLKTSRSSRDDDEEANLQRSGKRSRKNHWERERRERIAEGFDGLREVLHSLGIDANSKLEILEKSRSCLLRLVENFKMQDPSQAPGASPAPHQQSTQQFVIPFGTHPPAKYQPFEQRPSPLPYASPVFYEAYPPQPLHHQPHSQPPPQRGTVAQTGFAQQHPHAHPHQHAQHASLLHQQPSHAHLFGQSAAHEGAEFDRSAANMSGLHWWSSAAQSSFGSGFDAHHDQLCTLLPVLRPLRA